MAYRLYVFLCCIIFLSLEYAKADICTSRVCEYAFDVRHARSMTLRKDGATFNVRLDGSQIVPQLPDPFQRQLPTQIDPNEVITLDGVQRNLITINKTIPGPAIEVMEGAQIVVKVTNHLISRAVAIHWHGIHQKNTAWMDGVPYVTQCPIIPRQSFTYRFTAYPAGTHWYHSHLVNQRNDGLYGMLIVHKRMPVMPEYSLMVSDWHHNDAEVIEILSKYGKEKGPGDLASPGSEVAYGPDGVEESVMKYESSLINGRGRYDGNMAPLTTFTVMPGGQCRFRSVNVAGERTYEVSVDDHEITIVALDGSEIEHITADSVIINPGESVDFIIQTDKPITSYWIRSTTMRVGSGPFPEHDGIVNGAYAILKYDGSQIDEPTSSMKICSPQDKCRVFNCQFSGYASRMNKECVLLNDVRSVRAPSELAQEFGLSNDADMTLFLNPSFVWGSSINAKKFHFTSMPWSEPQFEKGSVSCDTDECLSPDVGCVCTHIQSLPYNKTIDMVLLSYQPGFEAYTHHAMHLHGHNFAVLKVGFPPYNISTGFYSGVNSDIMCSTKLCKTPRWNGQPPEDFNLINPPIKDTVLVPARGYVVIRFRSTNPGPWLLHCHSDSHLSEGMTMLFDEATDHLPPKPKDFPRCPSFDWSEREFENLLSMKPDNNQANNENGYNKIDEYSTRPTTSKEDQMQGSHKPQDSKETRTENKYEPVMKAGQVVISTKDFIGLIIGCVAFGAVLVILAMAVFRMCSKSEQTSTKL